MYYTKISKSLIRVVDEGTTVITFSSDYDEYPIKMYFCSFPYWEGLRTAATKPLDL